MTQTELFLQTVLAYGMFAEGQTVTVGFSGGADSVCLLTLLYENRAELGITVSAAHVNHGLRGADADADEAFVRRFCAERGIPLSVMRADVAAMAQLEGKSTELCARDVRYAYFETLGADKIATAHTGSDCVETLLMNLARGASLHGLASIPPVRGKIVRPLIGFTRAQTEAFCAGRGLSFVTDKTNFSDDYTRNKYRLHAVPALRSINPAFETAALRCLQNLRAEDDYMRQAAEERLKTLYENGGLSVRLLSELHPALGMRVLAAFVAAETGADYETKHLQLLMENLTRPGYALTLPGGVRLGTDGETLTVRPPETAAAAADPPITLRKSDLENGARVRFNGYTLLFESRAPAEADFLRLNYIDFYKIDDIIEIRSRLPGDRVSMARRGCTKSLKKLYTELGMPTAQRALVPVIADGRGVLWAYGAGADRTRLADKKTNKILIIRSEGDKNE